MIRQNRGVADPALERTSTPWTTRDVTAPLRAFLRTESGSAGILVAAIVAALIWANVDVKSYESVWNADFTIRLGSFGITRDLRVWINSGLMAFFFLVVGLEARREVDLGDLRDRRRLLLPIATGFIAMVIPIGIYLAINAASGHLDGWGVAMSTDTALALGALSLLARHLPERIRVFLLTMFVVDDIVALIVIAVFYTDQVSVMPLVTAILAFVVLLLVKRAGVDQPAIYALLGVTVWAALLGSGIDPVVAGLAIGLTATAYTPSRENLEEATGLVRLFREQPTPELARSAAVGLTSTQSPNARLQRFWHPWTSYLIVPLFGLANAGIVITGGFLKHAYTQPITLGVIAAYVIGKPLAVFGTSWLVAKVSRRRILPAVGWGAVFGSGLIGGVGFTVSFLIAALAFTGPELAEAKLGVLTAGVLAAGLMWAAFRMIAALPARRRAQALLGTAEQLVDLEEMVDEDRDHIRGPADATVTVVEYGDFECPYCGKAEPAVRASLLTDADVRFVWRHLPLTDVHPHAQLAAEAAEAAAVQGAFWEMHDLLLSHQENLTGADLMDYAKQLGLDEDRFHEDLKRHEFSARVAQDVDSADLSGVSGTPTFFINGQRHYGAYDADTLTKAVKIARARASLA
jgi:Na+/H+ antiporter NhaA